MQTITIEGREYDVKPLTPAQGMAYRRFIEDLAIKVINPWQELWEKVKDLPQWVQERAFEKLPDSILPLIGANYRRVVVEPAAVSRLFWLATGIVGPTSSWDHQAVYLELIEIVGPSLLVEVEPPESDRPVGPGPEMDVLLAPLRAEAEKRKKEEATDDTDMTEEEAIGHPAEI